MKALVVGGTGMLGHRIWLQLLHSNKHEVRATVRSKEDIRHDDGLLATAINGVDVSAFSSVVAAIREAQPDIVINCAGLIKQVYNTDRNAEFIQVNAWFPHELAGYCAREGVRLVHFSTDCVFDGKDTVYKESAWPVPVDFYGSTKLIGELASQYDEPYPNSLTLRTSIIGYELRGFYGLLEWFLRNERDKIQGFRRAMFSGLPTTEIAWIVENRIMDPAYAPMTGLAHIAADPISKFHLLIEIAKQANIDVEIVPVDEPVIDRSLDGARFAAYYDYQAPPWDELISNMLALWPYYANMDARKVQA